MGLGILTAELYAGELGEQTVADVTCIMCLVGLQIRDDAKLYKLRIGNVIQAEEVYPGFSKGGLVLAKCGRGNSGKKLA